MALSVRQKRFAKAIAMGLSQADARIAAYGESFPPAQRRTHAVAGNKLAKKPEVQAAIAEYAEQLMPIASYRALREEMESSMRTLALNAADERVRLAASKLLHTIAVEREEREHSVRTVTVDRLISEIGQLAPQPQTIELEAVDADEAQSDAQDEAAAMCASRDGDEAE